MHLSPSYAVVASLLFASASGMATTLAINVPAGLSLLGNPLDHPNGNAVTNVLPNPPEATQLYTFDAAGQTWQINQFQFGMWSKPDQELRPGAGAVIRSPIAFSVTFTGSVPTLLSVPINSGFRIVSWPLDTAPEWNANDESSIYTISSVSQALEQVAMNLGGEWYDSGFNVVPTPKPDSGKAFIVRDPAANLPPMLFIGNYAPGLNAPVSTTYSCVGTTLVAQLFYSSSPDTGAEGSFQPIGAAVPVVAHGAQGYLDSTADLLRQLPGTGSGTAQFRIWDSRAGAEWDPGRSFGRSIKVPLPSSFFPPPNLIMLQPIVAGPVTLFPPTRLTNQTVFQGGAGEFRAHDVPWSTTLAYQWQRSGDGESWTDIPGATSNRYILPMVFATNAGWYRVVMNAIGCADNVSMPARLVVMEVPRLNAPGPSIDGQVQIKGTAPIPISLSVERSPDLKIWTSFAIVSNSPVTWSVTDTNSGPQQFYRLRVLPQE